jgi:anti-anti-sigma factor
VSAGRILAAQHDGIYILKFVGDVRVNLCAAIDDYFEHMLEDPGFESVVVNLCEAKGIDSTTLGLLAKLALQFKRQFGLKPAIYCDNAGINRLLESMAFGKIFDIREQSCAELGNVAEIPAVSGDAEAAREKVIEAHRVLMDMSEENRERFRDLVATLE